MKILINISILLFLNVCALAQKDSSGVSLLEKYSLEELINLKITSASRNEQKIEEVPANVEIITADAIKLYGYKDIDELIQNITGFYKIEDYYWLGSSNYGVRGYFKTGPFSNVAILVNGVTQISDKYSDYPDVKITVPIEAVERVEVVKGPMAILYGNGAFFGAINIITNEKYTQAKNKFSFEKGLRNKKRIFGQFTGSSSDFNYKFIASYDRDDGPDVPYTSLTSDTSFLTYMGLSPASSTKKHLDHTRYFAGLNLFYKDFNFDISFNQSDKGVFDGAPAFNNGNNLKTKATNASVGYTKQVHKNALLTAGISFFNHNHTLNYETFRKYYYEIDMQNTNSIMGEINFDYKPTNRLSLTANMSRRTVLNILQISDFGYYGLSYGDGKSGLPEGERFSTNSLFLQLAYKITPNLTLIAGGRGEHYEPYNMYVTRGVLSEDPADGRDPDDPANRYIIEAKYKHDNNGFTFVPRISFIYQPFPKHFFKLLYGEAKKQPSFSENYRQLPQNRPKLHPSSIRTLEFIYYSYAVKNVIFNGSIFISKLNKLIENTNIYNQVTGEWEIYSANAGGYLNKGVECQIILNPTDNLGFDLRGLWQYTKDLKDGYSNIDVAYSPALLGYFNSYYKMKNLSFAVNLRYIDQMLPVWKSESSPEAGKRLGDASSSHVVCALNFNYDNLFGKNIFLSFRINNLFNTRIRYPVTNSNAWIDKGAVGEKINFSLKGGIKF